MNVVVFIKGGHLSFMADAPGVNVLVIDRDIEGVDLDRLEMDADGTDAVIYEEAVPFNKADAQRYLARTDCGQPRCPHCGCTRFSAHQLTRSDVIVDGNNYYIEQDGEDSCYDADTPYGPYTCKRCGEEFDELDELLQPEGEETSGE